MLMPTLAGGGYETVRLRLARHFAARGHDVAVLAMSAEGALAPRFAEAAALEDLRAPRARAALGAVARRLRADPPDVLLAGMWPATVIAPLAARRAGVPVVVSEHNTLSRQYAGWGRAHRAALRASLALGHRLAQARVAVSAGVAADCARLARLPEGAYRVIRNPRPEAPPPDAAAVAAARAAWPQGDGPRLLAVGSLKRQKRHDLLLAALARSTAAGARLLVLGEGPLRDELAARTRDAGLAARVAWPGHVADPTPHYRAADLFVLASDYEGMPNVLVEALAQGAGVVSTDCPSGPAEILGGGRHGRLVPTGDAAALACAIDDALARPTPPEAARAAVAGLDLPTVGDAWLDVLAQARRAPSIAAR